MQPAITDALTRALFVEWGRCGYSNLSMEAVARRAGVGKAALYRRWPSKVAMVMDRLGAVGLSLTDAPDAGSFALDVRNFLGAVRRALERPLIRRIVADLSAELPRSEQLRTLFETFQADRRSRAEAILRRAMLRGELPANIDVALSLDLLVSPLYWRMVVMRGRADDGDLERLTTALVVGIRATSTG